MDLTALNNMPKICQIIFSTNRPEYLTRTLESQKNLDLSGCSVDKVLIDDMPIGRDDKSFLSLVNSYGYNEVYLHANNLSIGATWQEFWDLIKTRDYDYVWHQEDDVEIIHPVKMLDLIDMLNITPSVSQLVLKRQKWYPHETESEPFSNDFIHGHLRGEFNGGAYFFSSIASLYSMDRVRFDYKAWYKYAYPNDAIFHSANINEALIGKAMLEGLGLRSMHVKSNIGSNLISHIGEYTIGKKVLPSEPGYAAFSDINPEIKYWSGTNIPYLKSP